MDDPNAFGDLLHFLDGLVRSIAPGFAGLAVASAPVVKLLVDLVKRYRPHLAGNVIQTITFGVSLVVVLIEAAMAGAFAGGVDAKEVGGLLIVTAIVFLGAIGVNEVTKDRGGSNLPIPAGLREEPAA